MKHLLTFTLLLSFYTVALFANAETFLNKKEYAYIQAKGTLKVYVEPDIYFYTYTYDNYLNGYAIHYLRLLAKKLDVELEFVDGLSRQEAKEKLSSGELDVALFPIFEGTSDSTFQLSLFPVGVVQPALLIPKIYQRSPTIESFENMRMVVVRGDAFGAIIKEKNPDAQIEVVETLAQAFTKVAQQEVDVAIGVHELFQAYLESKMIHTLQSIPLRNHADFPMLKLSLAMSSDNILLLSIINKAMAVIEYKELLFARNRFFPTNTFRQTNILAPLNEEEKFFLMGKQVLNVCIIPKSLPYGDIIN
ncbi:MAG: transporter substrate-binding domain-containing protein, partial [Sulfurospirillum sp.]|nr:transporter substrate-binding domain-containing protein [Sulfurospirillum sp.]